MGKSRLGAVAAAAVLSAFAIAACGGDDSSQDEDDITAAIQQAATSDDPANCTELQTQAFTEQTEFGTGEEALTSCQEADGDVAAESVEVESIEVDGDTATADATFTGGSLGGQAIAISLIKEGDQWKLDSLDEFTTFDKDAFVEGLVAGAAEGDTPQAIVDCVQQQAGGTSDEELQEIYLSGDPGQLGGLFGRCFQAG